MFQFNSIIDYKYRTVPTYRIPKTGYGSKVPTGHMIKISNRWHRVYCCIYSNSGTLFITLNKRKTTLDECQLRQRIEQIVADHDIKQRMEHN